MNGNMMGNMNPMQQMFMNMMQNGMGGQSRGTHGQMDCDDFEELLEEYCRDVARGRREMPRAFKRMLKSAWSGATQAVSQARYDEDDDEEAEDYPRRRSSRHGRSNERDNGEGFWDKVEKLHQKKGNIMQLNDELMRCFPDASPDEQNVLRRMAVDYTPETRKTLNKLMQNHEH